MNNELLKVENLNIKYGNISVLKDISFSVNERDYISIVGPNGSGKTTLLKSILGVVQITSGKISLNQRFSNIQSVIAYVPQVKTLDRTFPARAIDLVATGLRHKWAGLISRSEKKILIDILSQLNAEQYAYKQLSQLSGGELQRVYLAKSLVTNPKLILLDEPATGIDLVCESTVNAILNKYNSQFGTTLIMVTHDISAAYHHTNKTLLLNKNLIYFGESKDAFTAPNLQKTYSHLNHHHEIKIGIIKDV